MNTAKPHPATRVESPSPTRRVTSSSPAGRPDPNPGRVLDHRQSRTLPEMRSGAGSDANAPSRHGERRRRSAVTGAVAAAAAAVMLLATTACSGSVVHNYRTFQSALDRGASCSELFDQRARFEDEDTLAKIDRDLDRIGCTSRDATRND